MKRFICLHGLLPAGVLAMAVSGCSSNPLASLSDTPASLHVIPGEATLEVGKVRAASLKIPESMQLNTGGILRFSPIEFSTQKNHFNIEAATLPLGRYVAVRHSGEGITADLHAGEARSFELHYVVRYPNRKSASRDFPAVAPGRYRRVTIAGKSAVEIEQWHLRLSMIISRDRRAFRVLLDRLDYTAPKSADSNEDTSSQDTSQGLPVVVAFYYRHPNSVRETLSQQNVFFGFKVSNQHGRFHGRPQVSGWLPLPRDVRTVPYTVGIVVAEVHEKREDFYKKLISMVKNLRGLM